MKRIKILSALALGLVLVALLVVRMLAGHSPKDIPAGTGYAALELCTRTLQSGDALERVRARYLEPKVAPLQHIWQIEQEPGQRVRVQTWIPFMTHARTAVFREGVGCTVLPPGASEKSVRAQAVSPAPELARDERPWPHGEGKVENDPWLASVREVVDRHSKLIFSEPHADLKAGLNATTLLIAHDDRLIYERYAPGYAREQPQLGWSMTKTLTALIAGLFFRDGQLALDAPVGLSRWAGTPKAAITWRSLLNMAPGLAWFEGYGGASDATEMLFSQADQGAWAADRPLEKKPGTFFNYSTGFTNIAMLRMRELSGNDGRALVQKYQRELFAPLGIRRGVIELDASGTPVGGARGVLRPVDWLRLGRLVARQGEWNGTQIVPAAWMTFMTAASPADPGYGGFLWRRESTMIPDSVRAQLPADLVWFAGHMGQVLVVIPSQNLLVLRMGAEIQSSMERDEAKDQVFGLVLELLQSARAK